MTTPERPPLTGPQTIALFCSSGDGTSITATLAYDGASGVPSSLVVVNTSTRPVPVVLSANGHDRTVTVQGGTRTYSAATLSSWGLTDVTSQLSNVSAASP